MRRGRPGLMGTMARTAVIAGTATVVVGAVSGNKQEKQAAAQQQQAMAAQQQAAAQQAQIDAAVAQQVAAATAASAAAAAAAAPAAAAPAAPADDPMAELQKLADMKNAGLLDDAEFAAMKAKVLGI